MYKRQHNDNANAAKMEKLLEDGINAIGLGPQGMGGNYSVMGVNIEKMCIRDRNRSLEQRH